MPHYTCSFTQNDAIRPGLLTRKWWDFTFKDFITSGNPNIPCWIFMMQQNVTRWLGSNTGLILGLCLANERGHYFVVTSLIGWAQSENQSCNMSSCLLNFHNKSDFLYIPNHILYIAKLLHYLKPFYQEQSWYLLALKHDSFPTHMLANCNFLTQLLIGCHLHRHQPIRGHVRK